MSRLRARGWTFERIGQKYGLTRQRAFQIVRDYENTETADDPSERAA